MKFQLIDNRTGEPPQGVSLTQTDDDGATVHIKLNAEAMQQPLSVSIQREGEEVMCGLVQFSPLDDERRGVTAEKWSDEELAEAEGRKEPPLAMNRLPPFVGRGE